MTNGKMTVDMDSEAPGLDIYYSIDGSMPGIYSIKYVKPVELPAGNIMLRVVSYRNGKQIGHLIVLNPEELKKRAAEK